MADGPRCKRRKQANPRRNNVTTYNNGLEAPSDTDDEDKLHIVEEADGAECDGTLPDEEHPREHCWDHVKDEALSELDDERSTDALVEEMLQQGDTAVIYPEAPEDELPRLGTPEAVGPDENGTPDSFSQLLTCPYCARGYKRYSSLKEHIKYRHEKSDDSYNCPECSYSFAHRAQLERHMTAHKAGREQRHISQSTGNRKFKCTECGKAFKYKHHLKEHLRIHSGEKPYECSHCKKRFSHSGSYSSHISSKKCISVVSVNGRPRSIPKAQGPTAAPPSPPSLLRTQIRDKLEHKPLQEQLPINQIKAEPVDYEYKPAVMAPSAGLFTGGAAAPLQGTVQAVVLPTVGLVSPISINIADLQNALKVAVDGNVIRQVLESKGQAQGFNAGTLHIPGPPQQQLISAISLPIVGQDGNAKIIINYSVDPSQAQVVPQNLKKEPISPSEKLPEDLTVKGLRDEKKEMKEEEEKTTKSCLLCEHCPARLEPLHALKHGKRLNGLDKSESTIASLLSEGGLCTQPKNLLSLLKAYYALNAEPTEDELAKISDSVSLPEHVVKKWFDKMQQGALGAPTPPSEEEDSVVSLVPGKDTAVNQDSPTEATEADHSSPASPSPLNLTAGCPAPPQPDAPLDLSLPKPSGEKEHPNTCAASSAPDEPLNLTCMKKEVLSGVYASQSSTVPVHLMSTQLPALVALAEQGSVQCLRALGTSKRTILIPQLAYSYSSAATSPAGTETHEAAIQLNGIKEERADSEGLSAADEPDSDCGPARKKMKKTESGLYACDLCDKIFQKSSSLLRHKYEHTGKRPHECNICAKAFKHKHHLIEHMRLHSGEKPYQCDKCGKRFSHSGSYSQHMNHRYSYCKREPQQQQEGGPGGHESPTDELDGPNHAAQLLGPLQTDSDERGSRDSEEEDEEDEDGVVGIEDVRVVQVEEDEEEEGIEEEDSRQGNVACETEEPGEKEEDTRREGAMEGSEETSVETSRETPEETSGATPEETSRETSVETSGETSVETSEETSVEVSVETPEETSVETSEEAMTEVDVDRGD